MSMSTNVFVSYLTVVCALLFWLAIQNCCAISHSVPGVRWPEAHGAADVVQGCKDIQGRGCYSLSCCGVSFAGTWERLWFSR